MQAFHMYLAMVFIVLAIAAPIQPVTSRPQLQKRGEPSKDAALSEDEKRQLLQFAAIDKTFTVPDLPYPKDALEPVLSRDIMALHHDKHHKAYVDNLNKAIKDLKSALDSNNVKAAKELLPTLKFNLGGHINHKMFWKFLKPYREGGSEPPSPDSSKLVKAIVERWGCITKFMDEFNDKASKVQGSGWCWLVYIDGRGGLKIVTTKDQQMPREEHANARAIFGVDVWEHAYYLQYKNVRMDYLKAIWHVVNWKELEQRYEKVAGGKTSCPKGHK